jgi:hypothetical protein
MARRELHRRLHTRYAVLGDGQTEQFYLKHLKTLKGYNYKIYPSLFDDIKIDIVEIKIDELLSGGCDQIIYFTDYDTIVKQGKQAEFKNLKKRLKDIPEVMICESMPSIEFWFLLHYKKTTREFNNAETVCHELEKFINSYSKAKLFLQNVKWVEDLCSESRLENATKNATEILIQKENQDVGIHFPFTKVHMGIDRFEQQPKKKIEKI